MRAGKSIVKKCLVVLLTTVYLFIAVTYLLYLPKFSPLRITSAGNYTKVKSQPVIKSVSRHVNKEGANVVVLILRAYKSAIEIKREMFSKLLQIGLAFVVIIVSGGALLKLRFFIENTIKSQRSRQFAYLSYCALRI